MLGFEELVLTDIVKNKLEKWPIDIRVALRFAFTNATSKPEMVGDYADRRFETPPTTLRKGNKTFTLPKTVMEIYTFRIGYASFILLYIDWLPKFILLDLNFDDQEEATEHSVAA
jgi:hypothetical protein